MKNYKICLKAIEKDLEAFRYVGKSLLPIFVDCVTYNRQVAGSVRSSLKAITKNGLALEYVPEKLRNEEICLLAVTADGDALEYVPEKIRNKEICLAAVTENGYALEYVPEKIRNEEICLAAVTANSNAIQYVPEDLRN